MRSSMQQQRNLSIHEYLSASLLKSVRLDISTRLGTSDMYSMASVCLREKLPGLEKKLRLSRRVSVRAIAPTLSHSTDMV
jgi:hypothetical protein